NVPPSAWHSPGTVRCSPSAGLIMDWYCARLRSGRSSASMTGKPGGPRRAPKHKSMRLSPAGPCTCFSAHGYVSRQLRHFVGAPNLATAALGGNDDHQHRPTTFANTGMTQMAKQSDQNEQLSKKRLLELLECEYETETLDFKETLNLNMTKDKVEL